MADAVTRPTAVPVASFLESVTPEGRRADALRLDALFTGVTGFRPVMWGPTIVGYGRYRYRYDSGRTGEAPATGFSPRKANMVVYLMGTTDAALPERLGPHRTGRACLYLGRLSGIDLDALAELVRASLADLASRWPVGP